MSDTDFLCTMRAFVQRWPNGGVQEDDFGWYFCILGRWHLYWTPYALFFRNPRNADEATVLNYLLADLGLPLAVEKAEGPDMVVATPWGLYTRKNFNTSCVRTLLEPPV